MVKERTRKTNKDSVFGFDNLNYEESNSGTENVEFQEFRTGVEKNRNVNEIVPELTRMAKSKFKEFPYGFRHFCQDLSLYNIRKVHYIKSDWESFENLDNVSTGYLVYRALFFSFFVFAVTISMLYKTVLLNLYFIYLTNWSLMLQLIYSFLFLANVVHALIADVIKKRKRISHLVGKFKEIHVVSKLSLQTPQRLAEERLSKETIDPEQVFYDLINRQPKANCVERVISFLFSITGTVSIFVSFVYWTMMFDPKAEPSRFWLTFITHGLNAILCLIDVMICSLPVRVTHFLYVGSFMSVYILFTKLYDSFHGQYDPNAGPYIYAYLNWHENHEWTFLVGISCILVPMVLYFYLWFLYSFRLFLVSSCVKGTRNLIYWLHQYDYTDNNQDTHSYVKCPQCGTEFTKGIHLGQKNKITDKKSFTNVGENAL